MNDYFTNYDFLISLVAPYSENKSLVNLSMTCQGMRYNGLLWKELCKKNNLKISPQDDFKEVALEYLRSNIFLTVYTISQLDKKCLSLKKFQFVTGPDLKIENIAKNIFVNNIIEEREGFFAKEEVSVNLESEHRKQIVVSKSSSNRELLNLQDTVVKPLPDSLKITYYISALSEKLARYHPLEETSSDLENQWKNSFTLVRKKAVKSLWKENSVGGPFGLFNTPKNEDLSEWLPCEIPNFFEVRQIPGSTKVPNLSSPVLFFKYSQV